MDFALTRIRTVFPHFNRRPITETDFWRAAKKEKLVVREMPMIVNGYHERRNGRNYILLNKRLRGDQWLHTALHEFSHYLFDVPGDARSFVLYRRECGDEDDPREKFADAFAVIGMVPITELIKWANEDISDDARRLSLAHQRFAALSDFRI